MQDFSVPLIHFTSSKPLTVGVELELQLVDPKYFGLKSVSSEILKALGP